MFAIKKLDIKKNEDIIYKVARYQEFDTILNVNMSQFKITVNNS